MSLYERMYEFGIMKAIGTRPLFIFKLIIVEAFALALFSTLLGIAVGGAATLITKWIGINHLTDVEYLGTTIKSAIRPVPSVHQYLVYPFAIFCFAILSSIYPAISAAKIIPSKSMRKD
jgi:ABC-type antimicrobial peptide transport system permease subunit